MVTCITKFGIEYSMDSIVWSPYGPETDWVSQGNCNFIVSLYYSLSKT